MQGAVADDPGIIDQDIDWPDRGLNLSDTSGTSFELPTSQRQTLDWPHAGNDAIEFMRHEFMPV
jgi:hypothetical protein